ncbi:MAG: cysteine desulfurase [Gemmatimonadota bacterium]|nr:MAG: cysteine desulfurase [Gemmatimonadota bacterium]
MRRTVYLDYAATSPIRPQVRGAMGPFNDAAFGNPSSIHAHGRDARVAVEAARRRILGALGVSDGRLIFTGSGTESDNLALLGFGRRHPDARIICSAVEHKAVIAAAAALQARGRQVHSIPVNEHGVLDLQVLEALLSAEERPTLVSVMWANNETGVVQPIERVAALCQARGAILHSDAVQAMGKLDFRLGDTAVQMLSLSAHKLGGPKGIGALVVCGPVELEPLVYGGGQESGLRSGTENVAGIVGFAEAVAVSSAERERESARLHALRDRLEAGLREALPEIVVNGAAAPQRLPHITSISIPDVDIESLLTALDLEGVCVSSGSACTTGSVEASHVARAMGLDGDWARNTIRLSLGWGTEAEDIEYVSATLPKLVRRIRDFTARA